LLRRTATAFTSTGIPADFAVLCQLIAPCRRCRVLPHPPFGQPLRAGGLAPLGSMRFLSISSRLSPSVADRLRGHPSGSPSGLAVSLRSAPSPGWLPFPGWLQMVVSSFSCSGIPTGDFNPIYNVPMLGTHKPRRDNPYQPPCLHDF
jgi:hypothetical protein